MRDISNKTLAIFLGIAIVVSLGATIVSLEKLDGLTSTGFAIFNDEGYINVNITSTLSITTSDSDTVDFGDCSPSTSGPIVVNSEGGYQTLANCSGFSVGNISVRNNGNVDAYVNISFSNVGENAGSGTFLDSDSGKSDIAYKTSNGSRQVGSTGGCFGQVQANYFNATTPGAEYIACGNLSFGENSTNSFITNFQLVIPSDAPAGLSTVTVTYKASTFV